MGNNPSRRTRGNRQQRPAAAPPVIQVPIVVAPRVWDEREIAELVQQNRIGPVLRGREDEIDDSFEECPICFLFFPSLNRINCCRKSICTGCFVSVCKAHQIPPCPFCNTCPFETVFRGPLTDAEREAEAKEEEAVRQLEFKMRQDEIERDRQREESRQQGRVSESQQRSQSPRRPPSPYRYLANNKN
eukprot:c12418_g1_i2.p1 GENE.c12418_g1_i2~~c12418_g1_i2.p1  ORF type:complete len:188 (+),score=26.99 c12418_g1_i2:50-613(+)